MPLFPCPSCQQHIYSDASHCPHCAQIIPKKTVLDSENEFESLDKKKESQHLPFDSFGFGPNSSFQVTYGVPPTPPTDTRFAPSGIADPSGIGAPMKASSKSLFRRIWDWCIGFFSKNEQQ